MARGIAAQISDLAADAPEETLEAIQASEAGAAPDDTQPNIPLPGSAASLPAAPSPGGDRAGGGQPVTATFAKPKAATFAKPQPRSSAAAASGGRPSAPPSLRRHEKAAASMPPPTPKRRVAPKPGGGDAHMRKLYEKYVAARRRNGERVDNLKYETLAKRVAQMRPKLEKKHKGKKIDFEVVVKDGRVGLKPVAKD